MNVLKIKRIPPPPLKNTSRPKDQAKFKTQIYETKNLSICVTERLPFFELQFHYVGVRQYKTLKPFNAESKNPFETFGHANSNRQRQTFYT